VSGAATSSLAIIKMLVLMLSGPAEEKGLSFFNFSLTSFTVIKTSSII